MITAEQKKAVNKKFDAKTRKKIGDGVFQCMLTNFAAPDYVRAGLIKVFRGKVRDTDLGAYFLAQSPIYKALAK